MRGKKNTYDCYRLTEGRAVLDAENVSKKELEEQYGIELNKIAYAARTKRPIRGKIGKYRIEVHTNKIQKEEPRTQTIRHVSTIKTSSGCRFGG